MDGLATCWEGLFADQQTISSLCSLRKLPELKPFTTLQIKPNRDRSTKEICCNSTQPLRPSKTRRECEEDATPTPMPMPNHFLLFLISLPKNNSPLMCITMPVFLSIRQPLHLNSPLLSIPPQTAPSRCQTHLQLHNIVNHMPLLLATFPL